LHVPPTHLRNLLARGIGDEREKPSLRIRRGGPEAVSLDPEEWEAVEVTGIDDIPVEIECLPGAQPVHTKFKGSH
jgi:hypothetical protein